MRSKIVLIVDRDLGFVFWLGQSLDRAGYQALPAKSSADAIALLGRFHFEIDLLILNPFLEGAPALAETLLRSHRHLKIIAAIEEQQPSETRLTGVDASKHKPSVLDKHSRTEWLETIERVCGRVDAVSRSG